MDMFEAYGEVANQLVSPTLIAGRRKSSVNNESNIVKDILNKMMIEESNHLLEIGCGVGTLLTPLSGEVSKAVGMDHSSCLATYKKLGVPSNVQLIDGRWPENVLEGVFDRILVYSVLHYLPDLMAVKKFIETCFVHLNVGGCLMLGDIPNTNRMDRFNGSDFGKQFASKYDKQKSREIDDEYEKQQIIFAQAERCISGLTDCFIFEILLNARKHGFESYIVPQPLELPYSYTREDILIWRHK